MRNIKVAFLSALAAIGALFVHHYAEFPAPGQAPIPVALASPAPTASAAPAYDLELIPDSYVSPAQAGLIHGSQAVIEAVVKSPCFSSFILARALIHDGSANGTNGLTNAQVLARIQDATGKIPVTVYHQPWYKPSSVMGYRNVGESLIHLRDTSLDSLCDTASLEEHEAVGHILGGWDHDYKPTAARQFSVPYSINAGFSACCQ